MTTTPRRRRAPIWAIIAAAAITAAAIATGTTIWATQDDKPKPAATNEVEVDGTITLGAGHFTRTEIDCSGSRGYDDLTQGTQVTITAPDGRVIALGKLGFGKPTMANGLPIACVFPFHAYAPSGHGIYGIEVSHRGKIQVKESALSTVRLSLG